jgi:hypothetical protein
MYVLPMFETSFQFILHVLAVASPIALLPPHPPVPSAHGSQGSQRPRVGVGIGTDAEPLQHRELTALRRQCQI